jgi:hypothetical protein
MFILVITSILYSLYLLYFVLAVELSIPVYQQYEDEIYLHTLELEIMIKEVDQQCKQLENEIVQLTNELRK